MKTKSKPMVKIMITCAFVILICFALMIPPVSNQVSKVTGVASSTLQNWARTIAAILIGILLIMVGVASLAVVWLAVPLIIIGLAIIGYSVWPLFKPKSGVNDL